MTEYQDGGHQHREHRLLPLEVAADEPLGQPESGVVDQDVDRVGGVAQPIGHPLHLSAVAEIGHQHLDSDTELGTQLIGNLLQPSPVAGDHYQLMALGGQGASKLQADSGGGPADQRGAGQMRRHAPCLPRRSPPVGQMRRTRFVTTHGSGV